MASVRFAVLVRHHAHELLAAHLGLEGAANAAVRTSGDNRVLRLADFDDAFLVQRRGWAGLHAGAARHAFRSEEALLHAGGHAAVKATARDCQRKGALDLLAGAHAA